jgi:hypothetical protein
VNFKQTFESKGVLDAKQRLLRVSGDVREPFPAAVRLNIHLPTFMAPAKFGDSSIYACVGNNLSPAQHRPKPILASGMRLACSLAFWHATWLSWCC